MMSMLLRSKRQRMAPTVPAMVPLSKQTETVKKKKERVKKTLTKRPKEKREKKRKMVRERRKRKAMTKLFVVTQPRHFVLHIPNTPPHHHLCSRKKNKENKKRKQKKIRLRKKIIDEREKNPNLRKTARNARPILYDSEHQL